MACLPGPLRVGGHFVTSNPLRVAAPAGRWKDLCADRREALRVVGLSRLCGAEVSLQAQERLLVEVKAEPRQGQGDR